MERTIAIREKRSRRKIMVSQRDVEYLLPMGMISADDNGWHTTNGHTLDGILLVLRERQPAAAPPKGPTAPLGEGECDFDMTELTLSLFSVATCKRHGHTIYATIPLSSDLLRKLQEAGEVPSDVRSMFKQGHTTIVS